MPAADGAVPEQQFSTLIPWMMEKYGKRVYTIAADYNFGQISAEWNRKIMKDLGGEVGQFFRRVGDVDAQDAARVRQVDHEVPNTAAEENRARRRAEFLKEEARVRKMYEELVLKKAPQEVVQIGSVSDIKKATPSIAPVTISNANGNGNGAAKPQVAEQVAGD